MQGQETQENVISLFSARKAEAQTQVAAEGDAAKTPDEKPAESFEEIMRRNQANKDRMAKERSSANKSVLRSYRIKN